VTDPSSDADPATTADGPILGELVTTTFAYDGGREVTVYVPPDPPQAVVFAGDGELIAGWGGSLEAAGTVPTMIVGVHRTGDSDEMARIREYSPSFAPELFAAHEDFVVEEVGSWVRSHFGVVLPAESTAVCGVSAGAELALALGLRHPTRYGSVFASSPGGGFRPPSVWPRPLPRVYLTAGTSEPFFLENAQRWADALAGTGADVVLTERAGDHGDPFWQAEFPLMVAWAFPG
jgi:enterochelin esterase-like enzyme